MPPRRPERAGPAAVRGRRRAPARRPRAPARSPQASGISSIGAAGRTGAPARPPRCRARPRRPVAAGSMQRVAGSMSTSTGRAPVRRDRLDRRDERHRHGHDLAPGSGAEREQRKPQRLGAVADPTQCAAPQ